MPIKTACKCGKIFNVPESLIGKWVKCPACQTPLQINKPDKQNGPTQKEFDFEDDVELKDNEQRVCFGCNAHVGPDDKLCVICGTILTSGINIGRTERGMEDLSLKEKLGQIALIATIVATVLGIGWYVYAEYIKEKEPVEVFDTDDEEGGKNKSSDEEDEEVVPEKKTAPTVVPGTIFLNAFYEVNPFTKKHNYKVRIQTTLNANQYPLSFSASDSVVLEEVKSDRNRPIPLDSFRSSAPMFSHYNPTFYFDFSYSAETLMAYFRGAKGNYNINVGSDPKEEEVGQIYFKKGEKHPKYNIKFEDVKAASGDMFELTCTLERPVKNTAINFYSGGRQLVAYLISKTGDSTKSTFTLLFEEKPKIVKLAVVTYSKVETIKVPWSVGRITFEEKEEK